MMFEESCKLFSKNTCLGVIRRRGQIFVVVSKVEDWRVTGSIVIQ